MIVPNCLTEAMRRHREEGAPLPDEYTYWQNLLAKLDLDHKVEHNGWEVLEVHPPIPMGKHGFCTRQARIRIDVGYSIPTWQTHLVRWNPDGVWLRWTPWGYLRLRPWVDFARMHHMVDSDAQRIFDEQHSDYKVLASQRFRANVMDRIAGCLQNPTPLMPDGGSPRRVVEQ